MAKKDEKPGTGPDDKAQATPDEIIADLKAQIADRDAQIKDLTAQLAAPARPDIAGFVLEPDDPFADGVLRVFIKANKSPLRQRQVLPFVLPEKNPATVEALASYVQRAEAGNDTGRAEAAKKLLYRLDPSKNPANKPKVPSGT